MKSSQCLSTYLTYLNVFKLNKIFSEFFNWTILQFRSVQLLSHVRLFVMPWTTACQASLSITNSQSPPKTMSIESVMLSHPLSSPSPPAFNLSQHQGLFKWVSPSHQVAKILEFQLQHQPSVYMSSNRVKSSPCISFYHHDLSHHIVIVCLYVCFLLMEWEFSESKYCGVRFIS